MKKQMLPNIIEHSKQVMDVAVAIIDNLKDGIKINKPLVIAASLLHDITKTESLNTDEPHDITGGQFSRELGFNQVADIIEEHIILKNFEPDGELEEKEIVFYADKRVMHETIVTIEERMEDLIIRYGKTPERIEKIIKNKSIILKLEKKINNYMKKDINKVIHK